MGVARHRAGQNVLIAGAGDCGTRRTGAREDHLEAGQGGGACGAVHAPLPLALGCRMARPFCLLRYVRG